MSRLIDADKLSEKLVNSIESGDYCEITKKSIALFLNLISIEPTAFDKEKVLEQLSNASYLAPPKNDSTDYADSVIDLGDAISILEKGCIREVKV